ncbi:MAG TPA: 4-alpha-glucanotransferase, partial [Kofleriaceae bacterium]|nr:4-alpha-glucanotransferase [Kofleriaceae bacterium]
MKRTGAAGSAVAQEVAALCDAIGLDISYVGWRGDPVSAKPEAIWALLRALGPGFGFELGEGASAAELEEAATAVERGQWYRGPLVEVAWGGEGVLLMPVRASVDGDWHLELRCESGHTATASGRLFVLPATEHREFDGEVWCKRAIPLPLRGELGVHEVRWEVRGQRGVTTVISAPERAVDRAGDGKSWGVFAPLYGLRSARSGATGDLETMAALRRWISERGGSYVGTLPILAQFLDEAYNVSPYGPASRLFWNELYVALTPPSQLGATARAQLTSLAGSFSQERARLATLPSVDYRAQYAWKRRWIDQVAAECLSVGEARAAIERWAATVPVFDYAMFRAFGEMEGRSWHTWATGRDGIAIAGSLEDATRLGADAGRVWSHVVAQWMMHEQLTAEAADRAHEAGLYL